MSQLALIMALLSTFLCGMCAGMHLLKERWGFAAAWTIFGISQAMLAFMAALL